MCIRDSDKHVQVDGAAIRFQFVGKSGRNHAIDVKDRRLARIVKQCRDIPGYELFQYYDEAGERQRVSSGDVNDYLRAVTGAEFSAKDVRTWGCLLYTSDAADERSSVDLGGRRIIKKKKKIRSIRHQDDSRKTPLH